MATLNAICEKWVQGQVSLSPAQKKKEKELRPQLVKAVTDVKAARFEMGRLLVEYRQHFKGLYQSLYDALGVDERTARNYREDYERASGVPEALRKAAAASGYDIAEKRHESLGESLRLVGETKAADVATVVGKAIEVYEEGKKEARKKKCAEMKTVPEPDFDAPTPAKNGPVAVPSSPVEASAVEDEPDTSSLPLINTAKCSPELRTLLGKLKDVLRTDDRLDKELEDMLIFAVKLRLNKPATKKAA